MPKYTEFAPAFSAAARLSHEPTGAIISKQSRRKGCLIVLSGLDADLSLHPNSSFGDRYGVVTHAFQVTAGFQHGDNGPQVLRHRLLQGDDFQRFFLQFDLVVIDFSIVFNDLTSQFTVMDQSRAGAD